MPHCQCLYEIENNLPRTQHCFMACPDQFEILKQCEMEKEKKTSQQWYESIPKEYKVIVMDPDGWDRQNFQFSWYEEMITREEFLRRFCYSTVSCNRSFHTSDWAK